MSRTVLPAAALLLCTGCTPLATRQPAAAPPPPVPSIYAAFGVVQLGSAHWAPTAKDGKCAGKGPAADLADGAQVLVTDRVGTVTARGVLYGSEPIYADLRGDGSSTAVGCKLQFSVLDVPVGEGVYTVHVGVSQSKQAQEAELAEPLMFKVGQVRGEPAVSFKPRKPPHWSL